MTEENDIHRSEGEGVVFHPEYHGNNERVEIEDLELNIFLGSVVETFYGDHNIYDFRSALLDRLEQMSTEEKGTLIGIAERHFLSGKCELHKKEIVVPQHKPVECKLTEENINSFLVNDGLESLKRHLKYVLPDEWINILKIEAQRLESYKIDASLSGTGG